MTKKILVGHPHYCAILNQETVSGSQFYAEYIYNAFALYFIRRNTEAEFLTFCLFPQKAKLKSAHPEYNLQAPLNIK